MASVSLWAVDITCQVTINSASTKAAAVVDMPMVNLKSGQTYPLNAQDGLGADLQIRYQEFDGRLLLVIEKSRDAHPPYLSAQGSLAGDIILKELGADGTLSRVTCKLK